MSQSVLAQSLEEALAALQNPEVTSLNCSDFRLGNAGMQKIAVMLPYSNLTKLSFTHVAVGDSGVWALAEMLPNSQITDLELNWNTAVTDEGVRALSEVLPATRITSLGLRGISPDDTRTQAMQEIIPQTQLYKINFGTSNSTRTANTIALEGAVRRNMEAAVQAWDGRKNLTHEDWEIIRHKSVLIREQQSELANRPPMFLDQWIVEAMNEAYDRGWPVGDVPFYHLSPKDALEWMETHGQKVSSMTEFLNPDGTCPQDRFMYLRILCTLPDLWTSRAQAEKALRSFPEVQQTALPHKHQLLATLGQRDTAKRHGRG